MSKAKMKNHLIRIAMLGFICSLYICIPNIRSGFAQPKETPDTVRFKAVGCLYRAIQALNDRNVRFKALQEELDAMHPFEPQNLDTAVIAENIAKLTKYLRFLDLHKAQLDRNIRKFSDSVNLFSVMMGSDEEKTALKNFVGAYKDESGFFIQYSNKLSTLLLDIRSGLVFLQTVPMERQGKDVAFKTDRSANEKFMDYQSQAALAKTQVDGAIEKSINFTVKANKIIQESTSVLTR